MDITIKKCRKTAEDNKWSFSIFSHNIQVGRCLIEVMDGQKDDILSVYDAVEEHNCFDILKRIEVVEPSFLIHKIAFIRLLEINEPFQQKGFGKACLPLILTELEAIGHSFVILDAFKGGFLIPFYETFGFVKIPFPSTTDPTRQTAHNGRNFMWKKHTEKLM